MLNPAALDGDPRSHCVGGGRRQPEHAPTVRRACDSLPELGIGGTYARLVPRTPEELQEILREQMAFLRSSASSYDNGAHHEAKRLALTIRLLIHDTPRGQGRSLLSQLEMKDSMVFRDTAMGEPFPPLVAEENTESIFLGSSLAMMRFPKDSTAPLTCVPSGVPGHNGRAVAFEEWWHAEVVSMGWQPGDRFSRRTLVLTVANKDGGAHVDPELDDAYRSLSRTGGLWTIQSAGPPPRALTVNPVSAVIRQITTEVVTSLEEALPVPTRLSQT